MGNLADSFLLASGKLIETLNNGGKVFLTLKKVTLPGQKAGSKTVII